MHSRYFWPHPAVVTCHKFCYLLPRRPTPAPCVSCLFRCAVTSVWSGLPTPSPRLATLPHRLRFGSSITRGGLTGAGGFTSKTALVSRAGWCCFSPPSSPLEDVGFLPAWPLGSEGASPRTSGSCPPGPRLQGHLTSLVGSVALMTYNETNFTVS